MHLIGFVLYFGADVLVDNLSGHVPVVFGLRGVVAPSQQGVASNSQGNDRR